MRKNDMRRSSAGMVALTVLLGLGAMTPTPSRAQDDPAAGEKVFKRCTARHAIGEGAQNKVGPELNGLIGRAAGSLEGFSYSDAMVEAGAGGLVWSAETLSTYLENPKAMVPGTKMTFGGLKRSPIVRR
jgi:cytochrome c2